MDFFLPFFAVVDEKFIEFLCRRFLYGVYEQEDIMEFYNWLARGCNLMIYEWVFSLESGF